MRRGGNDYETCQLNGWGVGTRLVGDEGYGPSTIEITYLSPQNLLATVVKAPRIPTGREGSWTLECRDWAEVTA